MTIESIITKYLRENRRLTIPQLGTLIKGDDQRVLFVEFVSEDDDTLLDLVVSQAGVSSIEALAMVETFTTKAREELLSRGEFAIEGCVKLTRGVDGVVSSEESTPPPSIVEQLYTPPQEHHAPEPAQPTPERVNSESETIEIEEEPSTRPDIIMIVSIVAIVAAIVVILYSIFVGWQTGRILLPEPIDSLMLDLFGDGLSSVEKVVESTSN